MAKRKIQAADSDSKPFVLGYSKFGSELLFYVDTPLECVTLSLDLDAMERFVADASALLAAACRREEARAATKRRRAAQRKLGKGSAAPGAAATMVM